MKTFVVGDFHGALDIHKISTKEWPVQKELSKEDVLIQLGDFGSFWSPSTSRWYAEEEYWLRWLASKKFTFAFVPGNHENYDILEQLPIEEKWGGKVRASTHLTGKIYQLMTGEVYTINGNKLLVLGGADSYDKGHRTTYISWWPQELTTKNQENIILNNLGKHKWKVDYVVSHTCPTSTLKELSLDLFSTDFSLESTLDPTCKLYQHLLDSCLEFKQWHFGHWHEDWVSKDLKFFLHYKNQPKELI